MQFFYVSPKLYQERQCCMLVSVLSRYYFQQLEKYNFGNGSLIVNYYNQSVQALIP